jgi:hypothetical protein
LVSARRFFLTALRWTPSLAVRRRPDRRDPLRGKPLLRGSRPAFLDGTPALPDLPPTHLRRAPLPVRPGPPPRVLPGGGLPRGAGGRCGGLQPDRSRSGRSPDPRGRGPPLDAQRGRAEVLVAGVPPPAPSRIDLPDARAEPGRSVSPSRASETAGASLPAARQLRLSRRPGLRRGEPAGRRAHGPAAIHRRARGGGHGPRRAPRRLAQDPARGGPPGTRAGSRGSFPLRKGREVPGGFAPDGSIQVRRDRAVAGRLGPSGEGDDRPHRREEDRGSRTRFRLRNGRAASSPGVGGAEQLPGARDPAGAERKPGDEAPRGRRRRRLPLDLRLAPDDPDLARLSHRFPEVVHGRTAPRGDLLRPRPRRRLEVRPRVPHRARGSRGPTRRRVRSRSDADRTAHGLVDPRHAGRPLAAEPGELPAPLPGLDRPVAGQRPALRADPGALRDLPASARSTDGVAPRPRRLAGPAGLRKAHPDQRAVLRGRTGDDPRLSGGRGRLLATGGAELALAVSRPLQLAVFADAGQLVDHWEDFGLRRLAVGVGPGLRLRSSLGRFQLDLGVPVTRDYADGLQLHFATSASIF